MQVQEFAASNANELLGKISNGLRTPIIKEIFSKAVSKAWYHLSRLSSS